MEKLSGRLGLGGSVWVMGECTVGQWIVDSHKLSENIWFVWSKTSYSVDVTDAGRTDKQQHAKIGLLSF